MVLSQLILNLKLLHVSYRGRKAAHMYLGLNNILFFILLESRLTIFWQCFLVKTYISVLNLKQDRVLCKYVSLGNI